MTGEAVENTKKSKAGRGSKLTPKVQARFCKALRMGVYYESACSYAGITFQCFNNWRKRGDAGEEPYASFMEEVHNAERDCELRLVTQWNAHMPQNWQAIATFLERRYPEKWGRKDRVRMEGQHDVKLDVSYVGDWRTVGVLKEKEKKTNGDNESDTGETGRKESQD